MERIASGAGECARCLLERMRETPMRRGAMSRRMRTLRPQMARAIASGGVPAGLANRIAFQLALKFSPRDLQGEPVWRAMGGLVRREVEQLRLEVGMSPQRIVTVLPKLSAKGVIDLYDELTKTDRRIARTILHAAVNTSEPVTTGRRYMAEYRLVAQRLQAIDPSMARTVAAATFSAGVPLSKAMQHLDRFGSLLTRYQDTPQLARRLARAGFRAKSAFI